MSKLVSNVSGTVLEILVKIGDKVSIDQDVVCVESMKMEMMIPASKSGEIVNVLVKQDDFIQEGQEIFEVKD